jgi:N-acetylglucosaminyldiphosphoundecaprenol N-acetyl-beta-D-mannosaminyltransferase
MGMIQMVAAEALPAQSFLEAPSVGLSPLGAAPRRFATVGGMKITRGNRADFAAMMVEDARLADEGVLRQPRFVTSANGFTIASYHSSARFRWLIDHADLIDADGMPVVIASRLLTKAPLEERVATTDFIWDASRVAAEQDVRFFFLGARPGVADEAAAKLVSHFPGLQIVGIRDGYFDPASEDELIDEIVRSGAHVLWIGLGSPLQEEFAVRNLHRLAGLSWVRTCGGLFDHIIGAVPRAPEWMQRRGLEWLHRVLREPKRLGRRYLITNPQAAFHLLTKTRG